MGYHMVHYTHKQEITEEENTMYHAIEIVGYGKRQRFCIKQVLSNTAVNPYDGKHYATEAAAMQAAREAGIKIKCTGDLWQIIKYAE